MEKLINVHRTVVWIKGFPALQEKSNNVHGITSQSDLLRFD
jgi:hypothetical protein